MFWVGWIYALNDADCPEVIGGLCGGNRMAGVVLRHKPLIFGKFR
jgi:hypothetical protein